MTEKKLWTKDDVPDLAQREAAAKLYLAYAAACDAYDKADEERADEATLLRLSDEMEAAEDAYEEAEGGAIRTDFEGGKIERCAVTGVPLWDSDQTLMCEASDDLVLRAAIGLPPISADDAEDFEEAAEAVG